MPDISMPKFGGSGKVEESVDSPDVDEPSAEIGDAKVGGDIDANIEAPDAPKVDVNLKAGGGIDVDSPDAKGSVELPSGKISVKDPSIDIDSPSPKVKSKGVSALKCQISICQSSVEKEKVWMSVQMYLHQMLMSRDRMLICLMSKLKVMLMSKGHL